MSVFVVAIMTTINSGNARSLDSQSLDLALTSLAIRLAENQATPVEFVICGGSALILAGMVPRTTKDVDVVAMISGGVLYSPDPLPEELQKASAEVAEDLGLAKNWLNNGPSKGDGGLFQMGLPTGFANRLKSKTYTSLLTVHFIDRVDQIHNYTRRLTAGAIISKTCACLLHQRPNWKPQRVGQSLTMCRMGLPWS